MNLYIVVRKCKNVQITHLMVVSQFENHYTRGPKINEKAVSHSTTSVKLLKSNIYQFSNMQN